MSAKPKPKPININAKNVLHAFDEILRAAGRRHASDLHLKAGLPPIVRVDGRLYYLGEDKNDKLARVTNQQLWQMCEALMTPNQLLNYQSGVEVDLGYELAGAGRFRINICQQRSNPRMVCRYIPDEIPALSELNVPPIISELTQARRGLILVTGATGSGKSTTLAAMIDQIARTRSCHIVSIEDPIEFVMRDRKSIVTQREVGLDTRDFSRALKYALRQDPDVILVGEMRDEETILMALNAAETGHLVLSTLHTTDAPETINRILGSVSERIQASVRILLASTIVSVISQRLLRRKVGEGRIPAVEILLNNTRVRDMILDPKRTGELRHVIEESQDLGMQTFDQSLMAHVRDHNITAEEALEHCSNIKDFELRLKGVVSGDWRSENTHESPITGTEPTDEESDIEIETFTKGKFNL